MQINTIKRLYHWTDQEFTKFDFNYAKGFKDFGKGFYLTSNLQQAQNWAQKKSKTKSKAFIYSYKIETVKDEEWKVLELIHYDKKWLDYISKSRIEGFEENYDIIYDRIADNRYSEIADLLQEYIDKEISANKVIDKIKWNNYDADQYCFKNERAITLLKDCEVIVQFRDEKGRWKLEKGR